MEILGNSSANMPGPDDQAFYASPEARMLLTDGTGSKIVQICMLEQTRIGSVCSVGPNLMDGQNLADAYHIFAHPLKSPLQISSPKLSFFLAAGHIFFTVELSFYYFDQSYCCHDRTQRLGLVLKILLLLSLPLPLLLWPIIGIVGSLLVGVGYGIFTPLIATFEAVGEHVIDKFFHCFTVSSL